VRLSSLAVVALVLHTAAIPAGSDLAAQGAASPATPGSPAVFRGRVLRADGGPIFDADVWLIVIDKHVATDSAGAFRIDGLPAGKQLVQVRHVGFAVERDTIELSADHDNIRTYALAPQSTTLDTVKTVAGQASYLSPRLRAFEERRLSKQGGYFISDSVFRRNESSTLGNLLESRVPGLNVVNGKTLVSGRKHCRGLLFIDDPSAKVKSRCKETGISDCYVTIYLDGTLYYTAKMADQGVAPPDVSRAFNVTNFAGAEFYADGAASPAGMHSNDDGCGSLWLWTRER
jgi:hypothetical protein